MKKLEDVEAAEREKAFFECDVSDPEAEVGWLRDGKVRHSLYVTPERLRSAGSEMAR